MAGGTADDGFLYTIAPTVTPSLTGTVSKTYDGTTDATLVPGNYTLTGVLGGDMVTLNNPATGTYDNADVGTGKTVTVTGLAISGADAANYTLSSTTANSAVGIITAAASPSLSLTASDIINDTLLGVCPLRRVADGDLYEVYDVPVCIADWTRQRRDDPFLKIEPGVNGTVVDNAEQHASVCNESPAGDGLLARILHRAATVIAGCN